MQRFEGRPWPGNGEGPTRQERAFNQKSIRRKIATASAEDKHDYWLERYLSFPKEEILRLQAGIIGWHYWRCAEASYCEFKASRSQISRVRAWHAIRVCCQWLAQLERASKWPA